jgi:hypothetical protein
MRFKSLSIIGLAGLISAVALFSISCGEKNGTVDLTGVDSLRININTYNKDTTKQIHYTTDSGSYSSSITGRVFSAADNSPLPGVKVILTGDSTGGAGASRIITTDDNGYYQVQNLVIGSYLLTINKTATYSGQRTSVDITLPGNNPAIGSNSVVEINVKKDFDLLPLTASAAGTVYTQKSKVLAKRLANSYVAANAIVELFIADEIPDRYTATTSASGNYSFANVPATSLRNKKAKLIFDAYKDTDGTVFDRVEDSVLLQVGANAIPTRYLTSITNAFKLLLSNIQDVPANSYGLTTPVRLILSDAVDATRLSGVAITRGTTTVPVKVTVSGDTVTVTPTISLTVGTSYTLSYTLYSKDGRTTGLQTLAFSTIPAMSLISTNYYVSDVVGKQIKISDPIILVFNRTPVIDSTSTQIWLTSSRGLEMISVSILHDSLVVKPSANLQANTKYALSIKKLTSGIASDIFNLADTISTPHSAAPVGAVSNLQLQNSNFRADYNTLAIPVQWNSSSDAAKYNVYVKNNALQPNWLLLSANAFVGDNFSTVQRHSVSLNTPALDMLNNGATIEPFGRGAICSLMVVPVSVDSVEGGAATRQYFGIKDQTQPTIFPANAFTSKTDANMNNTTGASVNISFTVEFTEYMNTTQQPTLTIPTYNSVTFSTWAWGATEGSQGKNVATFIMTVPNNTNLDGKSIILSGINDLSGNAISTSVTISLIDN